MGERLKFIASLLDEDLRAQEIDDPIRAIEPH